MRARFTARRCAVLTRVLAPQLVATHAVRNRKVTMQQLASGDVAALRSRAWTRLEVTVQANESVTLTVQGSPAATVLPDRSVQAGSVLVHSIDTVLLPRYVRQRIGAQESVPGALSGCCQGRGPALCA